MYNEIEPIIIDSKKMNTYDIDNIVQVLEAGRLVVIPTETVYGIACNANNMEAVKKIYNIKRRDYGKPLLIHIGNKNDVYKYLKKVDGHIKSLIERFWPGPLSIVSDKKESVPYYITNGSEKVGIRCINNKLTQIILNKCKFPVVATSANISGYEDCYNINQIVNQFKNNIDLYIDNGELKNNIPSTVIEVNNGEVKVLREGIIKKEEII